MKIRVTLLSVALVLATATLATAAKAPAKAPNTFTYGGITATGAVFDIHTDDVTKRIDRVSISGKAHIDGEDKVRETTFSADAAKITVQFLATKPKQGAQTTGLDMLAMVKSGTFAGPVKMVHTIRANGVIVSKTVATADSGSYDGSSQTACLSGNVRIVRDEAGETAIMVGDKATMNLSPALGPDESRFRFESSPGVSSVTVVPKAREDQ